MRAEHTPCWTGCTPWGGHPERMGPIDGVYGMLVLSQEMRRPKSFCDPGSHTLGLLTQRRGRRCWLNQMNPTVEDPVGRISHAQRMLKFLGWTVKLVDLRWKFLGLRRSFCPDVEVFGRLWGPKSSMLKFLDRGRTFC